MPFTAQSLVDQLQVLIPGVTDSEALSYVNRSYKWLLGKAEIKAEPLEIAVTQNQQAYDISNDILSIETVLWVTGVDDQSRYTGTELKFQPDSQRINLDYGTPDSYSIDNSRQSTAATTDSKAQILLYPTPSGAVSGGYPKIVIYTSVYRALSLSDSVSNAVQFEDALLARAKQLLFEDYAPGEKSEYWKAKANEYLRETLDIVNRRQDGLGETYIPSISYSRRTAQ